MTDYPRVTEVLRAYTNYEHVPPMILKNAASKGTAVHALCAGIAKENWIPDSMIDEELLPYVNSFRLWMGAQVKKFIMIEKRLTNDELKYTGQLDYVILAHDDDLYLVDLKTSAKPQKTYPVQMAAYEYLLSCSQVKVKGAILVYLSRNGDFPEVDLIEDLTEERQVFFDALNCWHYFHRRKKHGRNKERTEHTSANIEDNGGT